MSRSLAQKLTLALWHLLPANPILVRVVSGASRRVRHLWLRLVYLAALVMVVFISLLTSIPGQATSLTDLAKNSSVTFKYASTAQLLLMCFLAPVFTASAITQERDAKTFNILLSTPLSSAQIVLGSLMSRLYFVIMLLLSGLPVFLITMVYGGVTARQVLESFALCAATAFITGALAIFVAMIGVGTRRTIFSFYLLIALYLLAGYLLAQWPRTWIDAAPANLQGQKLSWLAPLHPFLALEVALNELRAPTEGLLAGRGWLAQTALAHPSGVYVAWTMLTSLALVFFSIFFVRRGAKVGEGGWFTPLLARLGRASGGLTRTPRTVWANPVAWREATARAASGALIRWTIILAGLFAFAVLYRDYLNGGMPRTQVPMWIAGITAIQVALAMLIAANTAATSMTKEKESKTIEILLTTPLTPKYILWGKLRGLVSFATPLLAGPIIALVVFATTGLLRRESPPVVWFEVAIELAALLIVYTALVCVIGLRFSLNSRTNMVAVMASIGTIVLIFGAASAVGFAMVNNSGGEFGAFFAPFTPFTAMTYLISPISLFPGSPAEFAAGAAAARTTAFIGSVVAVAVYAFIVWRWYAGLVSDFDRTMRKQTGN